MMLIMEIMGSRRILMRIIMNWVTILFENYDDVVNDDDEEEENDISLLFGG